MTKITWCFAFAGMIFGLMYLGGHGDSTLAVCLAVILGTVHYDIWVKLND